MRVLILVASRHGSTSQIAEKIQSRLEERGLDVSCIDVHESPDATNYDAVIIGSAIYYGRWMKVAREYVRANAEALKSRPVFLFGSGPIGDMEQEIVSEEELEELREKSGAEEHELFGGRLAGGDLKLSEWLVTKFVRASEGDFRDWDHVRAWSDHIADELETQAANE